jgi:primosomal protein N'
MASAKKKMGGAAHRTKAQRVMDQTKMWAMMAKDPGISQYALAKKFGISQSMIRKDYAAVRDEFIERRNQHHDQWLAEELASIDLSVKVAWAEWERSQGDRESTTQQAEDGKYGAKRVVTKKTEGRLGDVRYLELIAKCRDQRAKLLGLYAPVKQEVTGANGGPVDLRHLPANELDQHIAELLNRAKPRPSTLPPYRANGITSN